MDLIANITTFLFKVPGVGKRGCQGVGTHTEPHTEVHHLNPIVQMDGTQQDGRSVKRECAPQTTTRAPHVS